MATDFHWKRPDWVFFLSFSSLSSSFLPPMPHTPPFLCVVLGIEPKSTYTRQNDFLICLDLLRCPEKH